MRWAASAMGLKTCRHRGNRGTVLSVWMDYWKENWFTFDFLSSFWTCMPSSQRYYSTLPTPIVRRWPVSLCLGGTVPRVWVVHAQVQEGFERFKSDAHTRKMLHKLRKHLYLHSVAEVGSSSDGHHWQQACPRPDVQDDHLLTSSLYSGHSRPNPLVVLLILKVRTLCQRMRLWFRFNKDTVVLTAFGRSKRRKFGFATFLCLKVSRGS